MPQELVTILVQVLAVATVDTAKTSSFPAELLLQRVEEAQESAADLMALAITSQSPAEQLQRRVKWVQALAIL